jgi:hypothetical protein
MLPEEELFYLIAEKMVADNNAVSLGKMMSSPGIKYENKVLAFFHENDMIFKLGKGFDPNSVDLKAFKFLSPFKNKGPMKSWFQIPFSEKEKWEKLTELALENVKKDI